MRPALLFELSELFIHNCNIKKNYLLVFLNPSMRLLKL